MSGPMGPGEYLDKARRALASARLLLDSGDVEGACNRAYYSMYDAAHAALRLVRAPVQSGTIRTHRGLIGAFGSYVVVTALLPRELGRALNEVEQIRLLADYTGDEVSVETAAWAIEKAQAFVSAIEAMGSQATPSE